MGLGIYIHIPYCLQRCTYCDFATYVHSEIKPPEFYVEIVKKEIALRHQFFENFKTVPLSTIYFGGGTPSLIPAEHIVNLIAELSKFGYQTGPQTEITIEINPATIDERKLEIYLEAGVNRFSVGAQTFSDRLLKMVHREHNAEQTRQTLALLRKYNLNFSFDLLFALPTQTLAELQNDLSIAVDLGSRHLSPYCLTVPEGHPLSKNRPPENDQIEMFEIIHRRLQENGFYRYEISNYSLPGFESKHNLLYWTDRSYWGLGLSAHSYMKESQLPNSWGTRFWNQNNFDLYTDQIQKPHQSSDLFDFSVSQIEFLKKHQSLTDFCHTSLRLDTGLSITDLTHKFGNQIERVILNLAQPLLDRDILRFNGNAYKLTEKGVLISNQVFEQFTFLGKDIL
ncbi:MAG: coproporphyrinogen III oxidase [Bdellovibrionales bacterium RIFCSPHIGHO2_01_FULL_40_29]|nr:MAG: coproporphyrinogen III oxidase [Bdellovibrionales bacterium RIFCSPHIGHO2_01_FULL_40_29]OFZ34711.1 MAG: coproporphyrinogen III oxidase [Bdellovibrionales bacterium RIFCSPHIGHO2_02_FULL_40_15]